MIADQYQQIVETVLAAQESQYDPWFYEYVGSMRQPAEAERYVRFFRDVLNCGGVDLAGKRVLDAGCGFGFTLLLCGLLGASELRGVEMHEGMLRTVDAYRRHLPYDLSERLDVRRGDVAAMPYDDASVDVVLSVESLSHYLEPERFAREAWRVLAPGGTLLISDGNNGLNPLTRRRTIAMWEAFENGPNDRVVGGKALGVCYRDCRRQFVAEHAPELSDAERDRLATESFGLTFRQLEVAVEEYRSRGKWPGRPFRRGVVPVDPTGAVQERLLNPYGVAALLRRQGFDAWAIGHWGGANGSIWVRRVNSALARLGPVSMPSARAFRVVGRKR